MTSTRPQSAGDQACVLDVEDPAVEQFAAGRRAWTAGVYRLEVAVDLHITHRAWLRRSDFRAPGFPELVWIDFQAAARVADRSPAGDSETAMLRIALTLAGHDAGHSLDALVSGLDRTNTTTVLKAIAHTAGRHHTAHPAQVTGALELNAVRAVTGRGCACPAHPLLRREAKADAPIRPYGNED